MRVAVVGEPTGWHVGRLTQRLTALGHRATVVRWRDIGATAGDCPERFSPAALDEADAVVVRGMPGAAATDDRLESVVFRMDALARLAARGTAVINSPRALEAAIDKYLSAARLAAAALPVPRCRVAQGLEAADQARQELGGDCALKPIFGSQGRGIVRVSSRADLVAATPDPGTNHLYLLQEFVPHRGWDVRVLVVGPRVFAMRRLAAPGDWRTNVALGGTPEPFEPPADWVELAIRAARCLETEVAGVDLLPAADGRVLLLEVNGVPGWRALEASTGHDVTGAVAEYIAQTAAKRGT
jgi:ribosomal protein S6--L-glutamate ligase